MFKRFIFSILLCTTLATDAMAATYEPVGKDAVTQGARPTSLLSSLWEWISPKPSEPPLVVPAFRPITHEPTLKEQRDSMDHMEKGGFYLAGYYKGFPKDINKGLDLLNKAAEYGNASACYELAGYYKRGEYGLLVDLGLAVAYERNAKWYDPGVPLAAVPVAPPVATSEDAADRRPSGGSDGSTSASDTSGEGASGLRHRVAVRGKP